MEVSVTNRDKPLYPLYVDSYKSIMIICPVCGYHLGDIMKDKTSTVYAPSNYCGFCGQMIKNTVLEYLSERKIKK